MARIRKVFISYRREDAAHAAGRIREWFTKTWGLNQDDVFMDVANILPGANFEAEIRRAIAQCDAMIVLISPSWLASVNHAPVSYPRLESEIGLASSLKLIPVRVDETELPAGPQLATSLHGLLKLNILPLRASSFDYDIGLVGRALGFRSGRRRALVAATALLLLGALATLTQVPRGNPLWNLAHRQPSNSSPTTGPSTPATGPSIPTTGPSTPSGLPHLTFTSVVASAGSGGPAGLVVGPDNAVWFTEYQANKIGKLLVPEGHVETEFAVQKVVGPGSIAAGSDGNLWFAEISSRGIGRMTPDGTYTEFPLPAGSGVPGNIVAGKDGNLWFLETGGTVAAMSTAGSLVYSYKWNGSSTYVANLLQGEDGNLWFSAGLDTLVRMTPGGVFTSFPATCAAGLANGPSSAGGPNDSIWFREGCSRNVVGRVNYSGSGLQEFTFPGHSDPGGIVKGSDGNMWLTSNYLDGGRIERCSPSGQVDEFKLSTTTTYAGLGGILSGPDGNLWFAIGGNGIGRFVP